MTNLRRPAAIEVGAWVRAAGQVRAVVAVSATSVTLTGEGEAEPLVVGTGELLAAEDFAVIGSPVRMPLPAASLMETLPEQARQKALWWEGHILEVLHGLPPGAGPDAEPRPDYGPGRSLTVRERAKAAELTAAGHPAAASTVALKRRRYQAQGVMGLADHRPVRKKAAFGAVDDQVVAAMRQAIAEAVDASTRRGTFIIWRTGELLRQTPEGWAVKLPSERTLYRLLAKLTDGTHTFGSAVTRRSRAHGAVGPFGEQEVFAPGEIMQIDSTPFDVLVLLDSGVTGKVDLTGMIDVATRTLTAAVLRPTTKSVDASVLLARTVTPEPMRPCWADALAMSRSVLPHRRLLQLDERLAHAAARPVIVPETIVCDHGKVFISRNFQSSCRFLQIEFQPTHKGSPFEKGHIEKMLGSVATLFAQFVAGYTGRSTDHRGRHLERERLWSLLELQELLDEWIVAAWQNRPHDGLRDPAHPGRAFTPNEKYAALIEACGYVPVALSGDDYVEVLPALWRVVNDYGIKIKNRIYDSEDLGPMRRQHSGVQSKHGLWEVHHDPYDVSRIWVRDHHGDGGWVPATWKHLKRVPVPFGDLAWDHVARQLPEATEEELAVAVSALLTRAYAGPPGEPGPRTSRRERRVAAHTKNTGPSIPAPKPAEPDQPEDEPDGESLAEVIPLGLFDPLEDPWRRK
ncbi:Mu transposase C-terminal domain-containing protein [Streptomyces sp. NPDC016459]|uniref:Mu transposase C-terminal domain-containing protein n=1 Tax=Streptomyces sp. NPDC016459 TaxID=3157190 RepID=UPI0033D377F4